jgi:PKHD-type hydroxylase
MSRYQKISNIPIVRSREFFPYCYLDDAFTIDELNLIENYCQNFDTDTATTVGADFSIESIRKSKVCHIKRYGNSEIDWFFERINNCILHMNDEFYNFELNGYESFQYTEYDEEYKGAYGYHIDLLTSNPNIPNMGETRKLSVVIFLSDIGSYEGGQFTIKADENSEITIEQKKGRMIFFPSFFLHKVHPLTKGTRKSIVVWVEGPKFK